MYTYNLKVKERTVQIKMLKAQAITVGNAIERPLDLRHTWRELTGTLGVDEHSCVLVCFGGNGEGQIKDLAKYQADCAAYVAGLPDLITSENVADVLKQAEAIWNEHLPVVDKRQTPEQERAEAEEWKTREAEQNAAHEAARLAWAAQYCDSPEVIPVPAGMQAVTIEANYDDSDMMTDYFHPHHGHGWEMVLAFVPKGARKTEALHREIIARYPELAALSWKWNVQDYSMGHGYWLESPAVGKVEGVTTYGGYKDPSFAWEVSFGYDSSGRGFMPFKGYAQANLKRTPSGPMSGTPTKGEGFELTYDRDWTWLHFANTPDADIVNRVHAAGGVFSARRIAFYFKRHVTAEELGLTAAAPANEGEAQASPAPAPIITPAAHLRELADTMQKDIDGKLDSATGKQNYTARRARIAEHMREEGYFLEKVQAALRTLADAHEAGTLPAELARITTRKAVTEALWRKDPALLSLCEGKAPDRTLEEETRRLEAEARRLVGIIPGYFPTPDPVITRMLELAPVGPEDTCLEPEAGAGNIAMRLREQGAQVDTIEWSKSLVDILSVRGFAAQYADFMDVQPNGKRYTRILMNPPFEKGQDMQHIRHAFDFLADGGTLVSVASPSVTWRSERQHCEFRDWLAEHGGETYDLPGDSFKESGTGVGAVLVMVTK